MSDRKRLILLLHTCTPHTHTFCCMDTADQSSQKIIVTRTLPYALIFIELWPTHTRAQTHKHKCTRAFCTWCIYYTLCLKVVRRLRYTQENGSTPREITMYERFIELVQDRDLRSEPLMKVRINPRSAFQDSPTDHPMCYFGQVCWSPFRSFAALAG